MPLTTDIVELEIINNLAGLLSARVERHGEKLQQLLTKRIAQRLCDFPGYAKIPRVGIIETPWSVEDGYMTPTLKLRRAKILDVFGDEMERLYAGH